MTLIPVVDAGQAAEWDRVAQEIHAIPSRVLMESAGRACATVIASEFPDEILNGVVVAAGPGNNGGDGWVVARALSATGVNVSVVTSGEPKTADCRANRELALASGVSEFTSIGEASPPGLYVDALLGTGSSGPLRGRIGEIAGELARQKAPVVAIDGPTGLDLSNGHRYGGAACRVTTTFGGVRRGHLANRTVCGRVIVVDIGFPAPGPSWPLFVDDRMVGSLLPEITTEMHKGDRGRIVVVGGSGGMSGAALHAVRAAFAAGAGLVKLVAAEQTLEAARSNMPDVMTVSSPLTGAPGAEVKESLEWADAVVLGPGLGRHDGVGEFVSGVVNATDKPMIIDADALRCDLAGVCGKRVVLTPHAGEFATLAPDVDLTEVGPYEASATVSGALKCAVLLKGVPTVISDGRDTRVVASGNPALATGGSGDILAGLTGCFLARGLEPVEAAAVGAQVLGRAAEIASGAGTVRATRPGDVLAAIPPYWRELSRPATPRPPILLELDSPATA